MTNTEKLQSLISVLKYLGKTSIQFDFSKNFNSNIRTKIKEIIPHLDNSTNASILYASWSIDDENVSYMFYDDDERGGNYNRCFGKCSLYLFIDVFLEFFKSDVYTKAKREIEEELITSKILKRVDEVYSYTYNITTYEKN